VILTNATNTVQFPAGTPYTITLRTRIVWQGNPPEPEVIYPSAIARATGYPDTTVPLGFDGA